MSDNSLHCQKTQPVEWSAFDVVVVGGDGSEWWTSCPSSFPCSDFLPFFLSLLFLSEAELDELAALEDDSDDESGTGGGGNSLAVRICTVRSVA